MLLVDGLLVAVAGVVAVFGSRQAALNQPDAEPLDRLAYALIVVAVAALLVRRTWPRGVLAVTVALGAAYLALGYAPGPIFIAPAVAMYTLAVSSPVRTSLAACALALVVVESGHLPQLLEEGSGGLLTAVPTMAGWGAAWVLLPWALGTIVRLGREEAGRNREEELRRRAYEERLRVAREVHDVVGHGLAVINMQAGIALHVLAKRPEQVEVALEAIKTTSKEALDELRSTLAVFRQPEEDGAPRRPAPGLAQLEALIGEMTDSGLPVDLTVSGERAGLPGAVDHAAYRIVQESLTNVLRHAGPVTARVRVSYQLGALDLEISDDGNGSRPHQPDGSAPDEASPDPALTGGHGIAGMRERAAAVGGTLVAGPAPAGGFRVHARLPTGNGP
jgi:signal transduction histidine kinase